MPSAWGLASDVHHAPHDSQAQAPALAPPTPASRADHVLALARTHLHNMVWQLVGREPALTAPTVSPERSRDWVSTIVRLATIACGSRARGQADGMLTTPQLEAGDMTDIRPYVHVKSIPGGSLSGCAAVPGVIARKASTHRMFARASLSNPRLLLIAGGLTFYRRGAGVSSARMLQQWPCMPRQMLRTSVAAAASAAMVARGQAVGGRGSRSWTRSTSRRATTLACLSKNLCFFGRTCYFWVDRCRDVRTSC